MGSDEGVWSTNGPTDGRSVQALAFDPVNPGTLYAGTYEGVFKSEDSGGSWTQILGGVVATAVAVHPSDPDRLYAGTWDGLLQSEDAGGHWTDIEIPGLRLNSIQALALDPKSPQTLYVGTRKGIFKSEDGGASWVRPSRSGLPGSFLRLDYEPGQSLVVAPQDTQTLYFGTELVLLGSDDGGDSWMQMVRGLPDFFIISALAIDPHDSRTLYAGALFDGIYKTTDAGEMWRAVGPVDGLVTSLVVDPTDGRVVYAGAGGVFRSEDGGESWTAIIDGLDDRGVNVVGLDPHDRHNLHAGTKSGVYSISLSGGTSVRSTPWARIKARF